MFILNKNKENKKKEDEKKSKIGKIKYSIMFVLFEIIFTMVTLVFIVFYGPFNNVKKTVVGALITSGRHQYIAKWFLSENEINNLTGYSSSQKGLTTSSEKTDTNEIHVAHKDDTGIDFEKVPGSKFKGYFLVIHDPTRVKVGYTKNLGKEGQLTSVMAEGYNASAAINGGDFQDEASSGGQKYTGTGGKPVGILISNGKVISDCFGNPNQKLPAFGINKDGKLLVGKYSVNDLKAAGVTEAISSDPIILINGKPQSNLGEGGIAPRTAIGQTSDGSILFLTIDGRQLGSAGATYEDVRNLMVQNGAINAILLDGGSSTTMYYNGEVVNNPSDPVGERYVPSIVYAK
ncbi:MAG: phosphodiester glycosidase family protein [Clostridium sp.]|nr:phosphodiester glycosidase family protein [Clostridium sp.]